MGRWPLRSHVLKGGSGIRLLHILPPSNIPTWRCPLGPSPCWLCGVPHAGAQHIPAPAGLGRGSSEPLPQPPLPSLNSPASGLPGSVSVQLAPRLCLYLGMKGKGGPLCSLPGIWRGGTLGVCVRSAILSQAVRPRPACQSQEARVLLQDSSPPPPPLWGTFWEARSRRVPPSAPVSGLTLAGAQGWLAVAQRL